MDIDIRNNEAAGRFEATVDGYLCHADYALHGDVMVMPHTEVPPAVGGRGIAGRLVAAAIEHARACGLRIDARCAFVRAYMQRHPETHALRA